MTNSEIIQAGKTTSVPFCTEITVLGGVQLPDSVRWFDCRVPDDQLFTYVTPWGSKPLGGERAQIVLGLRGPGLWEATTPISMSGYTDLRKASEAKLAEVAHEMIKSLERYLADYERAVKKAKRKAPDGGSCYFKPVGMDICNYGWSLIADHRQMVVEAFSA